MVVVLATASSAAGLSGNTDAAPPAAVGGDQHLGLGVVDAVGERLRREAAEHDAVGGADAGTGEHRHGRLGDHRQVDVDPVAGHRRRGPSARWRSAETSASSSAYVIARVSPGSPSKWMATLSPLPAATWRSRQLWATLSLPPTNHLAYGSSHSQIVSHSVSQSSSSPACRGPEPLVVLGRLVVHPRAGDEGVLLERLGGRERAVLGRQGGDAGGRVIGHAMTVTPGAARTQTPAAQRVRPVGRPRLEHAARTTNVRYAPSPGLQ